MASNLEKLWLNQSKISANSIAIWFGDFFNIPDILKQGKAKSQGIFSGGISIKSKISSKLISISFDNKLANSFLKNVIMKIHSKQNKND